MNRKEETTAPVIPPWDSFVAIGDSFTEGMTDPLEDGSDDPLYVGWADRLAMELSRRRIAANLEPLKYANLAVRGKLIGQVNRKQLDAAIAMKPELMSIIAPNFLAGSRCPHSCRPIEIISPITRIIIPSKNAIGIPYLAFMTIF